MSDFYRLYTPENVAVTYDLAGVGSRFLAASVDTFIQYALIMLILLSLFTVQAWAAPFDALRDFGGTAAGDGSVWLVALFLLAIFLLVWGYWVVFELLWNGQTPGKRLMRLRVLRDNGYPIGFIESLIRNLVRFVDFLPMFYGIGVITMLIDPRSRRLGDLAAGTIVVKERRDLQAKELLPAALPGDAPVGDLPNVDRLTNRDYSLLREYLLRREQLGLEARYTVASELGRALALRLDVPPPETGAQADALLLRVAAAYQAHGDSRR